METLSLRCSGWTGAKAGGVRGVGRRCGAEVVVVRKMGFGDLGLRGGSGIRRRRLDGMSWSLCGGNGALESENLNANTNEGYILKIAAEDVEPLLNGRCIYLVGMMGSGKTTVGKIMAEALGYSFSDSDKLVELAVGGTSVAQIFMEHSEDFFRDNESKALKELSSMQELVVGTGGGAVIRPINWKYMKKGVTVWLDVPIEALARRISAVGTASRPLLHEESGDAYSQALTRLTELFEERGESYSNADARVCLQHMAGKEDVNALTPTAIATEALIRIKEFLKTRTLEEVRMSTDEA